MRSLVGSFGDDLAFMSDEYTTGVDTVSSGTLPTLCSACKRLQSAVDRRGKVGLAAHLYWSAQVDLGHQDTFPAQLLHDTQNQRRLAEAPPVR